MALSKGRLEKSKKKTDSGGDSSILKIEEGKNYIRVFPFSHTVTEEDFQNHVYGKKEAEIGEEMEELTRVVPVHYGEEDGPINCLISDCGFCEKANEYKKSPDKDDQKIWRELRASDRFYMNVVNMDNNVGMQICQVPSSVYSEILSYVMDPEYGEEILGSTGRDFIINKNPKAKSPSDYYSVKLRDEKRCEELDSELDSKVQDLNKMNILNPGWSKNNTEPPEEKSEKEELPKSKKKTQSSASKEPEGEEDDLPWESKEHKASDEVVKDKTTGGAKKKVVKKKVVKKAEPKKTEPKEGDNVTWDHEGEEITGVIKKIDDKGIHTALDTDLNEWELAISDITSVTPTEES